MSRYFSIPAAVATAVAFASAAHAQVVVSDCGQALSGPGYLVADLDCSGHVGAAVVLVESTTFDLAGNTIFGGNGPGVSCEQNCQIVSSAPGGTIAGATDSGIDGIGVARRVDVAVQSVTIRDCGDGIHTKGVVELTGATIVDNDGVGVTAERRFGQGVNLGGGGIRARSSTVSRNGGGGLLTEQWVRLSGSDVSDNGGVGVETVMFGTGLGSVRARESTIDRNADIGIEAASRISIRGGSVSGNGGTGVFCGPGDDGRCSAVTRNTAIDDNGGYGIRARGNLASSSAVLRGVSVSRNALTGVYADGRKRDLFEYGLIKARDATVVDNGAAGLRARGGKVVAKGSTVTGNALEATCSPSGISPCLDIDGPDKAVVNDTVCNTPAALCSP